MDRYNLKPMSFRGHEVLTVDEDIQRYLYNDVLTTYGPYASRYMGSIGLSMKIKKVIFNNPATIVFWSDGSKTVVKCIEGDVFDPSKGLAMAISKRVLGDKFKKTFRDWLPKKEIKDIGISFASATEALKKLSETLSVSDNKDE